MPSIGEKEISSGLRPSSSSTRSRTSGLFMSWISLPRRRSAVRGAFAEPPRIDLDASVFQQDPRARTVLRVTVEGHRPGDADADDHRHEDDPLVPPQNPQVVAKLQGVRRLVRHQASLYSRVLLDPMRRRGNGVERTPRSHGGRRERAPRKSMTADRPAQRLVAVLVTYRRPDALVETLEAVAAQTVRPDRLVVVDNAPSTAPREAVQRSFPGAEYVAARENLGPAGGIALGMERILVDADDRDWLVTLDDDDPPVDTSLFADAGRVRGGDRGPRPAPSAPSGSRGCVSTAVRGRIVRVPDDELEGAVPVDSHRGQPVPVLLGRAPCGPWDRSGADLFFGFEELEFGLRLGERRVLALRARAVVVRASPRRGAVRAHVRAVPFAGRGHVASLLQPAEPRADPLRLRCGARSGSCHRGRGLRQAPRQPRSVSRSSRSAHLALNARAVRDGWTHRMGRTVEPDA